MLLENSYYDPTLLIYVTSSINAQSSSLVTSRNSAMIAVRFALRRNIAASPTDFSSH